MSTVVDVPADSSRAGFSLVEVIIAMLVLTMGVLAMAGTTALVVRQTTIAQSTSERAAALQSTIERLRGMDFDSLANGSDSVGPFAVSWTVTGGPPISTVTIVMTGPGLTPVAGSLPVMSTTAVDSFTYMVVHP